MKKIAVALIFVMCLTPVLAGAVSVKLDDGTEIPLDGLNDTEKSNMINYMKKINEAKAESSGITGAATEALMESAKDPTKLNEWRKLITGTIKDVANDLNITVNEFVKTPVGMGVAALIFYKVAGKDIFSKFMAIILAIPFWFSIIITCAVTARAFLGHKTEYTTVLKKVGNIQNQDTKEQVKNKMDDNDTVEMKIPKRVCRYDWTSNDARNTFGCFMIGIPVVVTIACFIVVFIA
jgi:hypothetical protein